ncbi:MAG: hypothetical protein LQ338_007575 [Usnochroma carphineum]|nr:MAG: hypothetical protein LQ338_007575 [Usnochroma carphineum]
MNTTKEFADQWRNPSDILTLLLIIGGDVVQHAIAQLFGRYVQARQNGHKLYLTPVAFSFGWVGYAFSSLASVIGDKALMPSAPDCPSRIINCDTGYGRTNRSWLLGRILRDCELKAEKDLGLEYSGSVSVARRISLRIDIFEIRENYQPQIDRVWLLGWLTIFVQCMVSIVPWARNGDWGICLITVMGSALALLAGSLRQWNLEKWAGRRLTRPGDNKVKTKTVCLTRGNGHNYAIILVGRGTAWDLESMAPAKSDPTTETPYLLGTLAVLWSCLLIAVSGLKQNTWFLILIGAMGMLQNIYAGAARRPPGALNMSLTPYMQRPSIIGLSFDWPSDDETSDEEPTGEDQQWRRPLPYKMVPGVRGAIREVEKMFPKAGVALMQEYFPALVKYEPERYRTNAEKKFWKKAFRELGMPVPLNHARCS